MLCLSFVSGATQLGYRARATLAPCFAPQVSYRGYWTRVLLAVLKDLTGPVSIKELSQVGAMRCG